MDVYCISVREYVNVYVYEYYNTVCRRRCVPLALSASFKLLLAASTAVCSATVTPESVSFPRSITDCVFE